MTSGYLRYPHIRGDEITFVADDDVWVVDAAGGRASRLSADRAPARFPFLSPDGSRIAYSREIDGHVEVMLLDRSDGSARRLTWWGVPGTAKSSTSSVTTKRARARAASARTC